MFYFQTNPFQTPRNQQILDVDRLDDFGGILAGMFISSLQFFAIPHLQFLQNNKSKHHPNTSLKYHPSEWFLPDFQCLNHA